SDTARTAPRPRRGSRCRAVLPAGSAAAEARPLLDLEVAAVALHLGGAVAGEVGGQDEGLVVGGPLQFAAPGREPLLLVLLEAAVEFGVLELARGVQEVAHEQCLLPARFQPEDGRAGSVPGGEAQLQAAVQGVRVLPQLHQAGVVDRQYAVLPDVLVALPV